MFFIRKSLIEESIMKIVENLTKNQECKIDNLFNELQLDGSPGCSVGVIGDGKFIYKKSFGYANLEHNVPINSETKFELGSLTKQFTAICIALLAIDGKLNLDDDIRMYIPELQDYGKVIKIKNLICHNSGMMDYGNLMRLRGIDYSLSYYNNKDIINQMSVIKKLNFCPGEKYQYTNTGYILLSEIVERVSGMKFSEFVNLAVFTKLGMTNSHVIDNWSQIIKNRATSYYRGENGEFEATVHISEHYGDMSLVSTLDDFLLWDSNFYSYEVGGEKLKDILSSTKIFKDLSEDQEYGLGLSYHKHKNIKAVSHDGEWLAYESEIRRYPEHKTSVILFCNTDIATGPIVKKITDIVLNEYIIEYNSDKKKFLQIVRITILN